MPAALKPSDNGRDVFLGRDINLHESGALCTGWVRIEMVMSEDFCARDGCVTWSGKGWFVSTYVLPLL